MPPRKKSEWIKPPEPELADPTGLEPILGSNHQPASLADITSGVSISFLAEIFRQNDKTVRRKLSELKPKGRKKNFAVYDLAEAASYLVDPKIDIDHYMRSLRPQDLPPWLQDAYWAGQLKRQKWELEAGDLWRTSSVMDVFAKVLSHIKTVSMLWEDQVLGNSAMDDEQRDRFRDLKNALLEDLHDMLVGLKEPGEDGNKSLLAESPSGSGRVEVPQPLQDDKSPGLDFLDE